MKKLFFIPGIVCLLLACEELDTDLPETDINLYLTEEGAVTFPQGTRAADIYNTLVAIFPDNEYHDVYNGEWQSVSFTKIRHARSQHESGVNTHKVYFYFSEENIKELVYKWQRQTSNVWRNDSIEGEIRFTLK